jgi:hypothetical protein
MAYRFLGVKLLPGTHHRYLNVDFDGVPPSSPLSFHSLNVDR